MTEQIHKEKEINFIKDFFWELEPTALHEMTTTKFDKRSAKTNSQALITVFQEHFTPTTRNIDWSCSDFFG